MKNKLLLLVLALLVSLGTTIASPPPSPIRYVDLNATGANDGSSWANAYISLQDALNVTGAGAKIFVAAGTYYPEQDKTGNANPTDIRTKTFFIERGIFLYGGFAGTETNIAERVNFGNGEVNETILSGDIQVQGTHTDNVYGVVYSKASSGSFIIDGFSIKDGYADGGAKKGAGFYYDAWGIASRGNPTINNCYFANNYGTQYGATLITVVQSYIIAPVISNCIFEDNSSNVSVNAMLSVYAGGNAVNNTKIINCKFIGNNSFPIETNASRGVCNAEINNCLIAGNNGGMYNQASREGENSSKIINTTITANSQSTYAFGAIYNKNSATFNVEFTNCIIWNNQNQSDIGSADANIYGEAAIYNNCLIQNITDGTGTNLDGMTNAAEFNYPALVEAIDLTTATLPTSAGDFHLLTGSPALDLGDNAANTQIYDLDGNTRIQNTTIDLGPYEAELSSPPQTAIPDTNFEQALIDLGIDTDGIINQQVATADISGVTSLYVSGKSITDLTGIEDFVALEELECYDNSLSSLNTTGLTNLSTIDTGNNELTLLDVSTNTSLELLFCSNNLLTDLDLSSNTVLTKVYVDNNSLTSLDISNGNNADIGRFNSINNPDLTCIYVDDKTDIPSVWEKDDSAEYLNSGESCAPLAINLFDNNTELLTFPNPVIESFGIKTDYTIKSVKLYNITGELVKEYKEQTNYSVANQAKGVYFVKIECTYKSFTQKLIIE